MTEDDMKFIKYVIGAINPGTSWEGGGGLKERLYILVQRKFLSLRSMCSFMGIDKESKPVLGHDDTLSPTPPTLGTTF